MSTSETDRIATGAVLVVGVGGLGCPAAAVLARAGVPRLVLCDDDVVDESNLHRQSLFTEADVGRHKLDAARDALARLAPRVRVDTVRARFLPESALELARAAHVVVEGTDNFATKFLVADACAITGTPVVHGSAIRWNATVWSVSARGRPCYRCLFEDVPSAGAQPTCDDAGVMGPVTGLAGALMADLCLDLLAGDLGRTGHVHTYDGRRDRLRAVRVHPRATCPLCGGHPIISEIDEARYTRAHCAA